MGVPTGGYGEGSADDTYEAEEQLALDDDDDALPWLEDDEQDEIEGGFDARLIWFALLGLVVIGALLLAAWWILRDRPDSDVVADGSIIEAPDGPYKERPEDPGGREVAGTGDTAYQVAEGETQRGRISNAGVETSQPEGDEAPEADSPDEASAAPANAVFVQIGAYTSRSDANAAWVDASNRYSVLSGMRHRVVEAEVNGARVYRLQVITSDRATGDATCRAIRDSGGDCYIR